MRKIGLGGGLSTRYGTAPRRVYVEILTQMRRRHECPRCQAMAVKRLSVGLWYCRKCGNQFTGGAYTPFTKIGEASKRSVASKQYQRPPTEPEAETPPPESKPRKGRRRKTEQVKQKEEAQ